MKPFLSIDVGGSAIKYGVITDGTTFLYRSQIPTPKDTMDIPRRLSHFSESSTLNASASSVI